MSLDFAYRDVPFSVRAAQVFGITTAASMAGAILGISFLAIPSIMKSPAPLAVKQWNVIFIRGGASMPPISFAASAAFSYLAWRDRGTTGPRSSLYLAAALLAPSVVPYTLIVLRPTNVALLRKASELSEASTKDETSKATTADAEKSVNALLDKWATLNLIRGILVGTASVLGVWAVVGDTKEMVFNGLNS